jgi:hypothetical protein
MNYTVDPGLYAVGNPAAESPVLVTANYKLTFDTVRSNLAGIDCWLLALDTKGVNVWCAAGKGTFGTDEVVNRIEQVGLAKVVAHRELILPQLCASGVNALEVKRRSEFAVTFGPIRAADIKEFINSGFTATPEMRTARFTFADRLVLTPVEFASAAKASAPVLALLFLLNLVAARQFGSKDFIAYLGALLVGTVVTPALLPWIPGRAFSWKGWLLGFIWTALISWGFGWLSPSARMIGVGYLLLLPSVSAYFAMNFTGSSTYTSFSGVIKEMKLTIPAIAASAVAGAVLILIKTFARG